MEDKREILAMLCNTLRKTRQFSDLLEIKYIKMENGDEFAVAYFMRGQKRINITADSGIAMIRDVVNKLF